MDSLISRQDAIDAADRADYTGLAVEDVKKVTDEVVKEIKKLPSAQQWIPVSERLPISTYWVVVTVLDESGDSSDRYASVGWYLSDGCWIVDNEPMYEDNSIRVVAWCELPEPWNEAR